MKTEKNRLMDVKAKGAKWLSLALCLTAGFSFSACSDDDGEGGGGAGSGVAAQQMPKVADAGIQFPVMEQSGGHGSFDFTYSDGRVVDWGDDFLSLSFNPLVIKGEEPTYTEEYKNIKMNAKGFMTYADYSYSWSEYNDIGNAHGTLVWMYDEEGHLVKEVANIDDSSDGLISWTCQWKWENGNLVSGQYEEDGDVTQYAFTYDTDKWENPGVYVFMSDISGCLSDEFFYSGLMGLPTRNIPTRMMIRELDGGEESHRSTYNTVAVNYNPDGSVQSIEMQNVFSYGSSYTETYRFGYADYPIQQQSGYSAAPAWKSPKAVHSLKARRMMKRK